MSWISKWMILWSFGLLKSSIFFIWSTFFNPHSRGRALLKENERKITSRFQKKKKAKAEKLETFQVIYNLFIWKQIFNKLLWQRNCLKQTCSCFLPGKFLVANFLLAGNLLYFPPPVDWKKSGQREWSHLNLRRCCSTKWNQGLSAEWHISQFENHTKIIYLSVKTIK